MDHGQRTRVKYERLIALVRPHRPNRYGIEDLYVARERRKGSLRRLPVSTPLRSRCRPTRRSSAVLSRPTDEGRSVRPRPSTPSPDPGRTVTSSGDDSESFYRSSSTHVPDMMGGNPTRDPWSRSTSPFRTGSGVVGETAVSEWSGLKTQYATNW